MTAGTVGVDARRTPAAPTVAGTTAYDAATRAVDLHARPRRWPARRSTPRRSTATDAQGSQVTTGKTRGRSRRPSPPGAPGRLPLHALRRRRPCPPCSRTPTPRAVTLGVRFTLDTAGTVTGVRFYKGPDNTGYPHRAAVGGDGTQLATGTFTNESHDGLADADVRHAGARSPRTPSTSRPTARTVGHYSATPGRLLGGGPVHGPAAGGGRRGCVHLRRPASRLDVSSTSYLVDVVFKQAAPPHRGHRAGPGRRRARASRADARSRSRSPRRSPRRPLTAWRAARRRGAGTTLERPTARTLTFTPDRHAGRPTDVTVTLSGVVSTGRAPPGRRRPGPSTTSGADGRPSSAVRRRGAAVSSRPTTRRRSSSARRSRRPRRHRHRRPVLQGRRQRRHPHGLALELARAAAGDGDLHRRDRRPAGRPRRSPRRSR